MPKIGNQKLKLLYVYRYLLDNTDEEHPATVSDIIKELAAYDIKAERRGVYSDVDALILFGLDVIKEKKDGQFYYYVGQRDFELAELKLITDTIISSKFITSAKSKELLGKIAGLTSKFYAKTLSRQDILSDRVKSMNESIYYIVDALNQAMNEGRQVRFKYYMWLPDKSFVPRNNGDYYVVSPWNLVWDDENYYLIAYDEKAEKIKYFRVDKIKDVEASFDKRNGQEDVQKVAVSSFGKKIFGMFDGDLVRVTIEFDNKLAGVVYDRFGTDIAAQKVDDSHFRVNTQVYISGQFYGWLVGLGTGAKITEPQRVVEDFKHYIEQIRSTY